MVNKLASFRRPFKFSDKALLIDFRDSYTYNLVSDWKRFGLGAVEVLSVNEGAVRLSAILGTNQPITIILGPGPGHPSDYPDILKILQLWLKDPFRFRGFIVGICLGHQLLAQAIGMTVSPSAYPKHGYLEEINWSSDQQHPAWKTLLACSGATQSRLLVQRYNSLAATYGASDSSVNLPVAPLWGEHGELMGLLGNNMITYQFHPESCATVRRALYFKAIMQHRAAQQLKGP